MVISIEMKCRELSIANVAVCNCTAFLIKILANSKNIFFLEKNPLTTPPPLCFFKIYILLWESSTMTTWKEVEIGWVENWTVHMVRG